MHDFLQRKECGKKRCQNPRMKMWRKKNGLDLTTKFEISMI
jgi:hypothetical protein